MTHDNLVDAVALGIANVFRDTYGLRSASSVDEFDDLEHFRKLSRAALSVVAEAMREPTHEMVHQAMMAIDSSAYGDIETSYRAMIAASPLVEVK